jgi:hypothetical protein
MLSNICAKGVKWVALFTKWARSTVRMPIKVNIYSLKGGKVSGSRERVVNSRRERKGEETDSLVGPE